MAKVIELLSDEQIEKESRSVIDKVHSLNPNMARLGQHYSRFIDLVQRLVQGCKASEHFREHKGGDNH
jgi:hypothetical protein